MNKFYQVLSKSKKSIAKNMKYSEAEAQLLYRLLKQYWATHEGATNSETYEFFESLFMKINEDIVTLPSIKSNNIKYYICKYLVDHPEELADSYNKIIREEQRDGEKKTFPPTMTYSPNILSSIRTLTIEALVAMREMKGIISPEQRSIIEGYVKASPKEQRKYRENCSMAQLRILDYYASYVQGDELSQLKAFLTEEEEVLGKELKSNYVESIVRVSENMDRVGLLEKYCTEHRKAMERIGLSGLSYNYEGDEKGNISVKSFFQRENIEKMDTYKLSMLNAFLINRYTKVLEDLNKTFFIVNELGLWSQIKIAMPGKDGKISIDVDESNLETLYRKMNFLDVVLEDVMAYCKETSSSEDTQNITMENGSIRGFIKVNVNDKIDELEEEIGSEYRVFFGSALSDSSNNFGVDFDEYRLLRNAIVNTYRIKDFNMLAVLFNLYQVKGLSKNWGVMPEERPIADSQKILLGFDIEGFNMPIRLHIDKSMVIDFLKANQGTTKMPVYEGTSDFMSSDRNIGTQLLMPLGMKQKKSLKSYYEYHSKCAGSNVRNLLEHIVFLKDGGKYPEHLKADIVVQKGSRVMLQRGRPLRKFVDLPTGEIFIEQKDGSLKKADPKERVI